MAENFLDTRCTESPKLYEPKQSYTKTYYDKNGKVRNKEKILRTAREKQSSFKRTTIGYQLISLQKHYRPEGS